MNLLILRGHLGKDPEVKTSSTGTTLAKFTLATNEKYKGEEKTQWHNCTAFGKTAEIIGEHLKKGSEILVQGKVTYSKSEKDGVTKYFTDILVDRFEFVGSKADRRDDGGSSTEWTPAPTSAPEEDDLPF